MSEAQQRVQLAALNRALDLLEDVSLSSEDLDRMIPVEAFGEGVALDNFDDVIATYRQRIAAWRPSGPVETLADAEDKLNNYLRLQRVVAAFLNHMAMLSVGLQKA
jgi:hypothetical protein